MKPEHAVAISLTIIGIIFTVVWFYYRKRMTRIEALESAVFGNTGVNAALHKYVTHEVLERRLGDVASSMKGLIEEGRMREERILDAITNQTSTLTSAIKEVKDDVRSQSLRIDNIISVRS